MGTSVREQLEEFKKRQGLTTPASTSSTQQRAPITTTPAGLPLQSIAQAPEFYDEPETNFSDLMDLVGSVPKLLFSGLINPIETFQNRPREKEVDAYFERVREMGRDGLDFVADVLSSPQATRMWLGEGAMKFAGSTKQLASNMFYNPTTAIPSVIKGALEAFVVQPMTAATGNTIVNGEVVPATSEEVSQGIGAMTGMVAGIGIWGKLAQSAPALAAGQRISAPARLGNIGRNMALEYRAEAVASVVQDAFANPDEQSLEAILNNVANPIVIAMSGMGGVGRSYSSSKAARVKWLEENQAINTDISLTIPSAKQVAVRVGDDLNTAVTKFGILTQSDDLIEAGIRTLDKQTPDSFRIFGVLREELGKLSEKYFPQVMPVKPKIPSSMFNGPYLGKKSGIEIRFEDPFDRLILEGNLRQISKQYGIDVPTLRKMNAEVHAKYKKADIQSEVFAGTPVRYKYITSTPIPEPAVRPRLYYNKNGTVLATNTPLNKTQFDLFDKTGFLPGERAVNAYGAEVRITGQAKNGNITYRRADGKIGSTTRDNLQLLVGGTDSVWNRARYADSQVDRFLKILDSEARSNKTFESLVQEFFAKNKWDLSGVSVFEDLVYRKLESEFNNTRGLVSTSQNVSVKAMETNFDKLNGLLNREADSVRITLQQRLDNYGYRIEPTASEFGLYDVNGTHISNFKNLNEMSEFLNRDLHTPNVPNLTPSVYPLGGFGQFMSGAFLPGKTSGYAKKMNTFVRSKVIAPMFRQMGRRVEDIAESLGVGPIGTQIATNVDTFLNSINAAENGIFKPLVERANTIMKLTSKMDVETKKQITRALEHRSLEELLNDLTPESRTVAAFLHRDLFRPAGGIQKVKEAYKLYKTGYLDPIQTPPNLMMAVNMLDESIRKGLLTDSKILRAVDAMDTNAPTSAMNQQEFINSLNWDKQTMDAFLEVQKFYDEAAIRFEIDSKITGYAPWLTKWNGVSEVFNRVGGPEARFIHELNRIGITPDVDRVLAVDDLVYAYTKSGIHHKSPVAGTNMRTGELFSSIRRDVDELKEISSNAETGQRVSLEVVDKWLNNIRGVPDGDMINDTQAKQAMGMVVGSGNLDLFLDFIALSKLGGRPILALRDFTSAWGMGLMYGSEVPFALMNFSAKQRARIDYLETVGDIPQVSAGDYLSRIQQTRLSKLTDIGMKISGQPQAYRMLLGNMYIHTFDKTVKALNKANGSAKILVDELGPLLDNGSRSSQEYFLQMATRDPAGAAKFLASRNAYNLAGRFGRLNNPMAWQSSYGRAFGQFGSWSINAATTMMEGINNSRNAKSAAWKISKLAAYNGAMAYGMYQAGLNSATWLVSPMTSLFAGGPAIGAMESIQGIFQGMFSNDERDRDFAAQASIKLGNLVTPTMINEMYQASQIMNEMGNDYAALMRGMGFKINSSELEGFQPMSVGTGVKRSIEDRMY